MLPIQHQITSSGEDDSLVVKTARNPFSGTRFDSHAREGQTISEIIECERLSVDGPYGIRALINGQVVPASMYPKVRPKAGSVVVLSLYPRGGSQGKAIINIVIGVLLLVASVVTFGQSAYAGGLQLAYGVSLAATAISGAIMAAQGVMSLVSPPPSINLNKSYDVRASGDSPAITGTRNTARLYQPVRTILGKYRVYPDLLGKPFSEQVGKDSVLRLLMCFGYGPLEIEDIRIGEEPIENLIPASKYNVLEGWDDDPELSIFRDEVDIDTSIQPVFEIEGSSPATLSTGQGPEEISIDLAFPQGLIEFNKKGKPKEVTVRFLIEEKEESSSTWENISTPTMGLGEDTSVTEVSPGNFDITLAERGYITRGLRWSVPEGSTPDVVHNVRVTRVSTTYTQDIKRVFSTARLSAIRTIKPHVASYVSNLAKIELEINASETGLSNIIDNLSAVCTSIAPKFDAVSKTWGPAHANISAKNSTMFPTRNHAWLFAQVLRGPANSRPIADKRIDGPGLLEWAGNLDGTGSSPISGTASVARNLDAVVDYTTTARKLMSDIASAGRGAFNIVDGRYSVVQDVSRGSDPQIIQHFSPRNSSGFSGAKMFLSRPHALRVHFVNPSKEYQRDEMIVYDDGYNQDGSGGNSKATDFSDLSLWGVSDEEQAYRDARYHLASQKLRPEVFSISADVEHLVCNRGDIVRVTHDVIGVGYGAARLVQVINFGGGFLGGWMDEEFTFEQFGNYSCRIRTSDGEGGPAELFVNVAALGRTSNQLAAQTLTSYGSNAPPKIGDLVLFGERETESLTCIVNRITPKNDLSATIELVEYNPAVYETGPIPEFDSKITLQGSPKLLRPVTPEFLGDPFSDEAALAFSSSGTPEAQILIDVATPLNAEGSYAATTHYHAQFRLKKNGLPASAWTNSSRVESTGNTRIIIRPVEEGETYDIRVRAISDSAASASGWIYANNHVVIGMATPPDPPTNLLVWGSAIRWDYGERPVDFAGYLVKFQAGSDATWSTGIPLVDFLVTDNFVQINDRIQPGETTLMVRAADKAGNESETLASVKTIGEPDALEVLNTATWTGDWSGTITNGTHDVATGELWADVETSGAFWSGGDVSSFWNVTGSVVFWGATVYKELIYQDFFDIQQYEGFTPGLGWPTRTHLPGRQRFAELEIEGASYDIKYQLVTGEVAFPGTGYFYNDPVTWPGVRELRDLEASYFVELHNLEKNRFTITVSGGSVQGKLKKAKLVFEALEKTLIRTVEISSSGSVVDLTGLRWRKITSVSVNPIKDDGSGQGALIGEAYDIDAAQTTTSPYELTGPTVKLWNTSDTAVTGTASVEIRGY